MTGEPLSRNAGMFSVARVIRSRLLITPMNAQKVNSAGCNGFGSSLRYPRKCATGYGSLSRNVSLNLSSLAGSVSVRLDCETTSGECPSPSFSTSRTGAGSRYDGGVYGDSELVDVSALELGVPSADGPWFGGYVIAESCYRASAGFVAGGARGGSRSMGKGILCSFVFPSAQRRGEREENNISHGADGPGR